MNEPQDRRQFLRQAALCGVAAAGLRPAVSAKEPPRVPDHTLTVIAGKPRERGRQYGRKFKEPIRSFLDKEIFKKFTTPAATREGLLRYAGQCARAIKGYSRLVMDELEGIAEGSGLRLEEVVLITLHEEVGKKGILPKVEHCTALAAGPPDTRDGNTYVGQNWDWMASVYGLSQMLLWKRPEGPSLLAYSYPGLWVGAGLNSAGIALCWTWGDTRGIKGPRVGIPSYVLIAQMLYQDTLKAALAEARRARHAGWFTFVLGDARGNLANVEGTPEKLVIETARGHLARADFATREITGTPRDKPVKLHPQCQRMCELLAGSKGKLDRATLQGFFGDHKSTVCKHPGFKEGGGVSDGGFTVDSMLFNCTTKEAFVSRGPGCSGRWKRFTFRDA
jgi:isopenicillin-N N-acyltransferase-like protein